MNKEVKRIRLAAHLVQGEFAKLLGVSTHTVSMWECGKFGVSIRNQRKIIDFCNKYGIDAEV